MQLRAVWYRRLIGDTEGPALIAGATWLRGFLPLRLLGTPTGTLTITAHVLFEPLDFMYRTYGMPRAQEAHDCRARIVPDNPPAFPPSLEVDAGGRAI